MSTINQNAIVSPAPRYATAFDSPFPSQRIKSAMEILSLPRPSHPPPPYSFPLHHPYNQFKKREWENEFTETFDLFYRGSETRCFEQRKGISEYADLYHLCNDSLDPYASSKDVSSAVSILKASLRGYARLYNDRIKQLRDNHFQIQEEIVHKNLTQRTVSQHLKNLQTIFQRVEKDYHRVRERIEEISYDYLSSYNLFDKHQEKARFSIPNFFISDSPYIFDKEKDRLWINRKETIQKFYRLYGKILEMHQKYLEKFMRKTQEFINYLKLGQPLLPDALPS